MGFLRKLGKKIKKGVKKLFKSKIGRILGGIGLSMIFWGGAQALFGQTQWWQQMQTGLSKLKKPFGTTDVTNAVNETSKVMDAATASKDIVTPTVTKDIPLIDKVSSTASSTPRVVDAATAVKDITPAEVLKDRPLIDTIDNPRFADRVKDFLTPDGGKRIKEYFGESFVTDVT